MTSFEEKYGPVDFDETDPQYLYANQVRIAVLTAFEHVDWTRDAAFLPDPQIVFGAMMVATVQILQAHLQRGDATDAAIRAAIMANAGWAVDNARDARGLPPLPDGQ
ncbi:MAG: hypothetical protein ACWA5A_09335 [Marinibacterium sp.]